MKILHIINSLETGGAERLIIDTLPLYSEQGFTVDLLLLNGTAQPFLHELGEKKCCEIFSLGNSSVYHPKHIFGIMPFLKKYDLVHVHLFPAQYYVVMAKILSGVKTKLIFTEHNTSNRRMAAPIYWKLDRLFYKSYAKIIAISEGVQLALSRHLKNTDNITILENGVNLAKVYGANSSTEIDLLFPQQNVKLLVQVGGFRIQKDQDTTIKSLLYLPTNYHLLLVGDGERNKQLTDLVLEHGLQNRVYFLGKRSDVFSILKSVDFVVVSSHWEGFGLAAIEGMAAHKPVIASDVPGLREVVKGAGLLFPVGDEKKLAEEILHLSNDKEYYDKIVNQCIMRADQFDIEKMVQKHIDLYQQLMTKL